MMFKMLNGDCLSHIFSFLKPLQLLTLEKGIPEWKSYIDYYYWRKLLKIDFDEIKLEQQTAEDLETFESKLKACENLIYFKYDMYICEGKYEINFTEILGGHCPKIQVLFLNALTLNQRDIELFTGFTNLKEVHIRITQVSDDALSEFLGNNPNLEYLILRHDRLEAKSLAALPPSMKTLGFFGTNIDNSLDFAALLKHIKNWKLHALSLGNVKNITNEFLTELAEAGSDLEDLCFYDMTSPLRAIYHFTGLKRLAVIACVVDNDTLDLVSKHCTKLEFLSLQYLGSESKLTASGLSCIGKLPNLIELELCVIASLNSNAMASIALCETLRVIRITFCTEFNNAAARIILQRCRNLTCLQIESGSNINYETLLKDAVEELDKQITRTNVLKIVIEDYRDNYREILPNYTHRLLKVHVEGDKFLH